jgi:predicted permease
MFVLALFVAPYAPYIVTLALGIAGPTAREGIVVIRALPSAVTPTILSTRYRMYERVASSTLAFTSLLVIATIPIVIFLIGG